MYGYTYSSSRSRETAGKENKQASKKEKEKKEIPGIFRREKRDGKKKKHMIILPGLHVTINGRSKNRRTTLQRDRLLLCMYICTHTQEKESGRAKEKNQAETKKKKEKKEREKTRTHDACRCTSVLKLFAYVQLWGKRGKERQKKENHTPRVGRRGRKEEDKMEERCCYL